MNMVLRYINKFYNPWNTEVNKHQEGMASKFGFGTKLENPISLLHQERIKLKQKRKKPGI